MEALLDMFTDDQLIKVRQLISSELQKRTDSRISSESGHIFRRLDALWRGNPTVSEYDGIVRYHTPTWDIFVTRLQSPRRIIIVGRTFYNGEFDRFDTLPPIARFVPKESTI